MGILEKLAVLFVLGGWSIIGIYIATRLENVCKSVDGLKSDIRAAGVEFHHTKEMVLEHKEELYDLRNKVLKLERH